MSDIKEAVETEADPLDPANRCTDHDDECKDVPGVAPDGHMRTHLACWLYDPGRGFCPFLLKCT